jgi:hypothetical protein
MLDKLLVANIAQWTDEYPHLEDILSGLNMIIPEMKGDFAALFLRVRGLNKELRSAEMVDKLPVQRNGVHRDMRIFFRPRSLGLP